MRSRLKRVKEFIIEPANLVMIFLLVMIVPNMVLIFTENFALSTIGASILIPAGFYVAFLMIANRPGTMILWAFPLIFLAAFQLVISYLFGNSIIAIDMFTNVFTTNVNEAGELLGNIYPSVIIVIILYVPILVFAILSIIEKKSFNKKQRVSGATLGIVCMLLGFGLSGVSKLRNPNFAINHHVFPVNVCYNISQSVVRWNQSLNYFESSEGFEFHPRKEFDSGEREVYVLVIGEASRAMSWSLAGYERETNPRLESRAEEGGLVFFDDVLTQSNTTHKSVPIILSPSSAENFQTIYERKSIIELFKQAGFKTAFISNQPANRSLTEYFSMEADTLIPLVPQNLLGGSEHYDIAAVPVLKELIEADESDLFVVIHTYGSHASHNKRYTRDKAKFLPDQPPQIKPRYRDQILNAYDNTIVYTDYVLDELMGALEQEGLCSALLYCSDHGEDVLDDDRERFLHASPTTTYYQLHVAALAWFSDSYRELYPTKFEAAFNNAKAAATTASVFHSVVDMANIECGYLDKHNSLLNPDWENRPRYYIDDYNRAVNVLQTGLTSYDIELFQKQGIEFDIKEYEIEYF